MLVTVFRAKSRPNPGPEVEAGFAARGARMFELASAMPGFVSYKEFASTDGETVAIAEFDTHEHLAAWGAHPEHREAQEWGRQNLLSEYQVQVCEVVRTSRFPR